MNDKIHIVVGNDYAEFAKHRNVLTILDMMLALRDTERWTGDESVIIGQGISDDEREMLRAALRVRRIHCIEEPGRLVPLQLTHKSNRDNVLISEPRKIAEGRYQFNFTLNDILDRLSDHVTGQHVGAMLLMEAARQAVIVTLEEEYCIASGTQQGLILERFHSQFDNYVFPLPASMLVVAEEMDSGDDRHTSVVLTIAFYQAGQQVCEMLLDVKLYEAALLEKVENLKARKTIDMLLRKHAAAVAVVPAAE